LQNIPFRPGTVSALKNITLAVQKGESFIIAGKSGSGKTTLLNCIGGLEKPDHGTVRCAGADISRLSRKALSRF
jgi:ABC-type lipoprotein export system ATPase subunit